MAKHSRRFPELTSLGLQLAAISVDPPERSRALAEQLELGFPLLCDTEREVVGAYGLLNSKEKGGIAFPATLVLDRDRSARFRSLDRTASRVDLDTLFVFLRGGAGAQAPAQPHRAGIVPGLRDWSRAIGNAIRHGTRSPKSQRRG